MISAAAIVSCVAALMPGSDNTVAASTAADDDVAETMAYRLVPISA
jgi:threonine/homoserine/homoserine lactone efflux protein